MKQDPDEVVRMIKCLLSDEIKFITGEVIRIDGGDWL